MLEYITKAVEVVKAPEYTEAPTITKEEYEAVIRKGIFTEWFINPPKGQPRMVDIFRLRQYGHSEWVNIVVSYLLNRIKIIPYEIVAKDPAKRRRPSERIQAEINRAMALFDEMTPDGKNFKAAVEGPLIRDILELDAGALNKCFTAGSYIGDPLLSGSLLPRGQRVLAQVVPLDGGSILKDITDDMRLKCYWQYSYRKPRADPTFFDIDEIVYFDRYARSYSPYGWSPIQASDAVLNSLINSAAWNANFFSNQAIPKGMITLEGTDADVERFRMWWKSRIEGKWHNIPIVNSEAKFVPFSINAADMEWLSGQKWYQRMVCALYQVHPSEVGVEDTSRQSGDALAGRDRLQKTASIAPLMGLVEDAINNEILSEISPRIMFRYVPEDPDSEKIQAEMENAFIELGVKTINQIRDEKGEDPVPWGNLPPDILNNLIRSCAKLGKFPTIEQMDKLDFKGLEQVFPPFNPLLGAKPAPKPGSNA